MVFIDGFPIDAVPEEKHSFTSKVTVHPVEDGADIADHTILKPIVLTLSCTVSDTPIGEIANARAANTLPSDDALAFMEELRRKREPVVLETSLGGFSDMLLEDLSVPRRSSDGDSLRFTARFVQLELVTNDRTTVKVSAPRGRAKKNRGNASTKTTDGVKPQAPPPAAKTEAVKESLITSGIRKLF